MARMKERSSLDCIPSVAVVRIELERKRQEVDALQFLLGVSEEVERRRTELAPATIAESRVAERVVDRLPSVEDVEQELDRNRSEASILRTIHRALKRRQSRERTTEHFRRLQESGVADGK